MLTILGTAAVAGLAAAWWLAHSRGPGVDTLVPDIAGMIGFWVVVAGLAGLGALLFAGAAALGSARSPAIGILMIAILEALLVALPYNPQIPPRVVPDNKAMAFLQDHASEGYVAATGTVMLPNTAMLYGLDDVRTYDVLISPRTRAFWSDADPGYRDDALITLLSRPDMRHLTLAGVAYVMTPVGAPLPGTRSAYAGQGVGIGRVPGPHPFAYAAAEVALASDLSQATRTRTLAPVTVDVVEESCCGGRIVPGSVRVTSRAATEIELTVDATSAQTVIVRQTYDPAWHAAVDGISTPVVPANLAFQAVRVPAGHHLLRLSYSPMSVALGLVLSLIGVVGACAALYAGPLWHRRPVS